MPPTDITHIFNELTNVRSEIRDLKESRKEADERASDAVAEATVTSVFGGTVDATGYLVSGTPGYSGDINTGADTIHVSGGIITGIN